MHNQLEINFLSRLLFNETRERKEDKNNQAKNRYILLIERSSIEVYAILYTVDYILSSFIPFAESMHKRLEGLIYLFIAAISYMHYFHINVIIVARPHPYSLVITGLYITFIPYFFSCKFAITCKCRTLFYPFLYTTIKLCLSQ